VSSEVCVLCTNCLTRRVHPILLGI
jgi:hypothetical protein